MRPPATVVRGVGMLAIATMAASIAWGQAPAQQQSDQQKEQRTRPEVFFPMKEQPEMEMHQHGQIQEVMPNFPKLGDSQRVVSGKIYELAELEKMASEHNPALREAQHETEEASEWKRQAGLYPNPTVGYRGDEIRGGSYGGGEQGFFVAQPIILGGKLRLDKKVRGAEEKERAVQTEAQRQRVENDVRLAYYRVLAAQERLALQRGVLAIAQSVAKVVRQLGNIGQADETEILEAEAEEQRMEIAVRVAEHQLSREWTTLASVVGMPLLEAGGVAGRIDEELPPLKEEQLLTALLSESPEVHAAQAGVERAEAALTRAKRDPVPDLLLQGGLQQNGEALATPANRKVGLQGFAEVGVQLHLWDRNQGAIAAQSAELESAREEVRRVELVLRARFAKYGEDYGSARLTADKYRAEILPRLEKAYQLMTEKYGMMTASFLRVLLLERMVYENEGAYLDALEQTWTSSIVLRGFLLQGGLGDGAGPRSEDMRNEQGRSGLTGLPSGLGLR